MKMREIPAGFSGSPARSLAIWFVSIVAMLSGPLAPSGLYGQGVSIGVQGSSSQYSGFGVGPRAILDLGPFDAGLRLIGSFELFFPGQDLIQKVALDSGDANFELAGDADYWEANLNLVYTLGLPLVPITPYLGGGVNFARTKLTNTTSGLFDGEGTDQGVNILAGVELGVGPVSPFAEFRYVFSGGDQWVLTGGIVF